MVVTDFMISLLRDDLEKLFLVCAAFLHIILNLSSVSHTKSWYQTLSISGWAGSHTQDSLELGFHTSSPSLTIEACVECGLASLGASGCVTRA